MTANSRSLEEKESITRLKQGDLDGLEFLVKAYQVRAVYAAYHILRDLKLAEDIVQDAFIRAAEKIEQFDERRSFGPWFLRSVINASIKAAERQKRMVSMESNSCEEASSLARWLLDPKPGPEEIVETEDARRQVWSAMEQLTPEQRAVIIMHHFFEMSETEIMSELNRPVSTVHWWLRTARRYLKGLLRPFWQTETQDLREKKPKVRR